MNRQMKTDILGASDQDRLKRASCMLRVNAENYIYITYIRCFIYSVNRSTYKSNTLLTLL